MSLRRMSRRTVIYPTFLCNLSCPFCYYRFMQHKVHYNIESLRATIDQWKHYYIDSVDITGGEPTIYPDLRDLIAYLDSKGYGYTIITNGLRRDAVDLAYEGERFLDFLVSVHGDEKTHNTMVGAKVFDKLREFMDAVAEYGSFRTNTVVTKVNMNKLDKLASLVLKYPIKISNLIMFNPHSGTDWAYKQQVPFQCKYSEAAPHIKSYIDTLEASGVWVNVRYIPICVMKGYEKHVTNFLQNIYEPYEWENLSQFKITRDKVPELAKQLKGKAFGTNDLELVMNFYRRYDIRKNIWTSRCKQCSARLICDGIYPQYYNRFGDSELSPYDGKLLLDPIHFRRADRRWLE